MSDTSAASPANANKESTNSTSSKENGVPSTSQPPAPTNNNVEPPLVSISKPADPAATKPADTKQQVMAICQKNGVN